MIFVRALALLLALSGSALAQSGQIPSGTVWGNSGASKTIASPATFTAMFDRAFGSTTGAVIARSAAAWGLVSGTTTTVLHGNAGGAPSFGSVVNADLAQAAASTLKGNATASTANVTDFTVTGLTSKATPVGADELLLSDSAASNAFKKASVTAILSGAVTSLNGQTGALTQSMTPQGRLTLQSFTPVMTASQAGKTTIYYTGYVGIQIPILDGSGNYIPTPITGGEISVATTDTTKSPAAIGASKVNDWFVWNDAGTIRLSHGPDWTNDTTRSAGTVVSINTGIFQNTVSITNGPAANRGTYVGTTRSNASSQLDWIIGSSAVGGGMASLYVWNAYNQVRVSTAVNDASGNWNYTSTTVRAANGSASNRVNFVSGLPIHGFEANYQTLVRPGNVAGAFGEIGIALDSTTVPQFLSRHTNQTTLTTADTNIIAAYNYGPQTGVHFLQATENADGANTANFFGGARGILLFATHM